MLKIFVDSGSCIKCSEQEKYGVEVLPLRVSMDGKEFLDGLNLESEDFYRMLTEDKIFPKTSLPALDEAEERVRKCVAEGNDVIILPISGGISGTCATLRMMFKDEPHVKVIDTHTAVGGIRFLIEEVKRNIDKPLDYIEERLNDVIPRIKVIAIPDTLEYLHRGGRLSKTAFIAGSLAHIKPLIGIDGSVGNVKVFSKSIGRKKAMRDIVKWIDKTGLDTTFNIIPTYTYNVANVNELIESTDEKYVKYLGDYDDIDPAIACHWGPHAFGYVYVAAKEN